MTALAVSRMALLCAPACALRTSETLAKALVAATPVGHSGQQQHPGGRHASRSLAPITSPGARFFSSESSGALPAESSVLLQSIDLSHPNAVDRQKLSKLIQEVVKTKANTGDFVPRVVIESLCSKYHTLNIDEKKQFLLILARDLHVDTAVLQQSLEYFNESFARVKNNDPSAASTSSINWDHENIERYLRTFRNLRQSLSPLYETFFQQILSQREGGMLFLVHLRADLLQVLRKNQLASAEAAALRSLDNFLASWFSVGFLNLERVTYEKSSGQLLEKIIRYEAVHPVGTIIELKRRLGKGRRCFAFFHPSVPDEPLVFVHVALVKEIASSMQYIREETEHMDNEHDARAAIFYSISSTQKGLQGVDLGNFLIKEVAKALKTEHNQLDTFATLSPIPQFVSWLETKRNSDDASLVSEANLAKLRYVLSSRGEAVTTQPQSPVGVVLSALAVENWFEDAELEAALQPILLKLGARYIFQEKKRGKALCPVSNFHIRNGAIFERINWLADPSAKGLHQSAGMMVNYKYDLKHVETNNENYLLQNVIPIGEQPQRVLRQD